MAIMWCGSVVLAEQSRPAFTKENRFPDFHQVELGTIFQYNELGDEDEAALSTDANEFIVEPFVRYQATEKMALQASLPYVSVDPDLGNGVDELGDISLGAEWLAYEHIYSFPYIIPHVTVLFDTGDEEKALAAESRKRAGETRTKFGITLGTMRWENWTFNGDLSYTLFSDAENIFAAAGSVIWDLSEEFSWLIEGVVSDEDVPNSSEPPGFVQGGFSYHPYERFQFTAYGGGGKNLGRDVSATLKLSYDL